MLRFRLVLSVCTLAAAMLACACAAGKRQVDDTLDIVATGQAVRKKWRPMGIARRDAIERATGQARRALWQNLLKRPASLDGASQGIATLAQLAVEAPAFSSKLRAMIADLEPEVLSESPEGLVTVRLTLPRPRLAQLAANHGAALRNAPPNSSAAAPFPTHSAPEPPSPKARRHAVAGE